MTNFVFFFVFFDFHVYGILQSTPSMLGPIGSSQLNTPSENRFLGWPSDLVRCVTYWYIIKHFPNFCRMVPKSKVTKSRKELIFKINFKPSMEQKKRKFQKSSFQQKDFFYSKHIQALLWMRDQEKPNERNRQKLSLKNIFLKKSKTKITINIHPKRNIKMKSAVFPRKEPSSNIEQCL